MARRPDNLRGAGVWREMLETLFAYLAAVRTDPLLVLPVLCVIIIVAVLSGETLYRIWKRQ